MAPSHVVIIGGGLSGCALAVQLAKRGIRSSVFEIRSKRGDIGGGLMLAINALRVMDKDLGVLEKLQKVGFEFEDLSLVANDGTFLGTVKNGDAAMFGYKSIRIQRTSLHQLLLDKCAEFPNKISISYGKTFTKITESKQGVTVDFADGTSAQGDILIGCDGIHSKVREMVLGDEAPSPHYTGMAGIGAIVNRSDVHWPEGFPIPSMVFSQVGVMLVMPVNPDASKIGWAMQQQLPEKTREGWAEFVKSGEAAKVCRESFGGLGDPIDSALSEMDESTMAIWPHHDLPLLKIWHTDRVLLMGDAAHALSPYAGQSGAQAFEDGSLIARMLEAQTDPSTTRDIFARFEAVRKPRIAFVREQTAQIGRTRHKTSGFQWLVKKYGMKLYFAATGTRGLPAKMFSYDITEEKATL